MFNQERLIRNVNDTFETNNTYQKYIGNITLEELFTIDSIYISACRCAGGFRHKNDTFFFMKSAWFNSYQLRNKILGNKFKPSYYPEKIINERGKLRKIKPPTFECKVVQKVICDYLIRPLLEPKMISTNYASIKNRGTAKMYEGIYKALGKCNKDYSIVISDFKNYFASIDIEILKEMLNRYIKDERIVELIILFSPEELSLGNELSQVPASFYPNLIDHTIKDKLGVKYYFRYMDDTLAIIKSQDVQKYINSFNETAQQLNLPIKKIDVISYGKSFVFCKERYLYKNNYYRITNPQIIRNEKRKLLKFKELYKDKKIQKEEIEIQYRGVRGMIASHPNTKKQIQGLDEIYTGIFI